MVIQVRLIAYFFKQKSQRENETLEEKAKAMLYFFQQRIELYAGKHAFGLTYVLALALCVV